MKYCVDPLFWGLMRDFEIIEAKTSKHALQIFMKQFENKLIRLSQVKRDKRQNNTVFKIFPVKVDEEKFVKWNYRWLTKMWNMQFLCIEY